MKKSNFEALRKALFEKEIVDVKIHGGHGMVLTITVQNLFGDRDVIDICTYDDEKKKHDVDEFYVGLNGDEL